MSDALADVRHRTGRFLDAHPVVRWFVVPILFMATAVLLLALALPGLAPLDAAELTAGYLAVSAGVVVVGLAVERVAVAVVDRWRGG